MSLRITPSLDEFRVLAQRGDVIPVSAELVADSETPVSAFAKLHRPGAHSFLFESTEKNDVSGRFSFVGTEPREVLSSHRGDDVLKQLEALMSRFRFVPTAELPRFIGGAVGFVAYDAVNSFESKVPLASRDEMQLPQMLFMITGALLIFDHRLRTLRIVVNVFTDDGPIDDIYHRAVDQISKLVQRLSDPAVIAPIPVNQRDAAVPASNFTREQFEAAVETAKEYIRAGDVFQVVLSQRFELPFSGAPLDLYRCLRFINPSPYMFCLTCGDEFALVGSSPEMHVRLVGDTIDIRPIAGTRPRGLTNTQDEQHATDLLADEKERAEHVMLVDLARNDVGRVAEFGSVSVTEFMNIERYSHVMHIVSNVTARLRTGCTAFDLLRATFPAGTVSGAPKIRAMQIIAELERTRRGPYAGAVGYFGFDGNFDSCIALRSAVLKTGRAYFQAGAGIVADSNPSAEFEETTSKARAIRNAIALAMQLNGNA